MILSLIFFLFITVQQLYAVVCRLGECDLRRVDCNNEQLKNDTNFCVNGQFVQFFNASLRACQRIHGPNATLLTPGDRATNHEVRFDLR